MPLLTELEKTMQCQSINIALLTERESDAKLQCPTWRLSDALWVLLLDQRYRIFRFIIVIGGG
jgi:hypothetical protein